MKLAEGEIVLTITNRKITPFPKIDTSTKIKSSNTLKRIDNWLIDNAITEAKMRNDKYNLRQFENVNRNNITQSDKDLAHLYLFNE
jgi:hypothetical protein